MTNKDIKNNNEKINTINYLKAYELDTLDYELLQSVIIYLETQDYDLLLEAIKSYLLLNKKLNYKTYREIALSLPFFNIIANKEPRTA